MSLKLPPDLAHLYPALRLVLEDKVTMTEIMTLMTLDDLVVFSRVYDPWYAVVNRPRAG